MTRVTIEGIQEAQDANLKAIEALQPEGPFGRAIRDATVSSHAYAVKITHVDSGALKASHRMKVTEYKGIVFMDQDAMGPNGMPSIYGPAEHERGGSHAFYERTVSEAGQGISQKAIKSIVRATLYGR